MSQPVEQTETLRTTRNANVDFNQANMARPRLALRGRSHFLNLK